MDCALALAWRQATERDVLINHLPLFHIFGYVDGPLGSMLNGYRQVLTDTFAC